jgi:hypothetical protein
MRRARIVGSGKRVLDAALPAFLRAADRFELAGIHSRTPKRIEAEGRSFDVAGLDELDDAALADTDVIYMVVAKDAVPAVLRGLTARDVSSVDLLIDTPVLRFKWMGHLGLLERFRRTWVTEDCATLPCYDAIEAFLAGRALERVTFDRAAYAYHGLAMGRTLLRASRVRSAHRTPLDGSLARRSVRFVGGGELAIVEPRDYAVGRVELTGAFGTISDDPATPHHRVAPVLSGGACTGFRVDDTTTELSAAERELMGSDGTEDRLTSWMEGMKRVGFLRLLQCYAEGRGAYPLDAALEDTVVDYHLEKFGRYVRNPFTSPHVPTSRLVMKALTRLAER